MAPAVAVAKTARERSLGRPTIAAICRPIAGGTVEPEFVADEIRSQGFPRIPIASETADLSAVDVLLFLGDAAWRRPAAIVDYDVEAGEIFFARIY